MSSEMTTSVVDSTEGISDLVDLLYSVQTYPPSIYVDVEGVSLSRHGTVSILIILVQPKGQIYLVDIHTLGALAFTTGSKTSGKTLKGIFQSDRIPKYFFDVRNDSDALFAHYKVALMGVRDLQLMENASRSYNSSKRYINGLAKCVENDARLSVQAKTTWKRVKETGQALFDPAKGGSRQVFNERPLKKEVMAYCCGDVMYMPQLRQVYLERLTPVWQQKVLEESKKRVEESWKEGSEPFRGKDGALGPWKDEPVLTTDEYWQKIEDEFDDLWLEQLEEAERLEQGYDPYDDDYPYDDNDFEDWTQGSPNY